MMDDKQDPELEALQDQLLQTWLQIDDLSTQLSAAEAAFERVLAALIEWERRYGPVGEGRIH
jgi:uncharacterized protein (UPF0548 family)